MDLHIIKRHKVQALSVFYKDSLPICLAQSNATTVVAYLNFSTALPWEVSNMNVTAVMFYAHVLTFCPNENVFTVVLNVNALRSRPNENVLRASTNENIFTVRTNDALKTFF